MRETEGDARPFFIRVMKTGSSTFEGYLRDNIPPKTWFPAKEQGGGVARFDLGHLRRLTPEQCERIRGYSGHYPAAAAELVPHPVRTLTLLRDPVERTISYLRQCKRDNPAYAASSLAEIYVDPDHRRGLIENHQAKIFAMPATADSFTDPFEMTQARLESAMERLSRIDFVGLMHRHAEFSRQVGRRLGWGPRPTKRLNVAPPDDEPCPAALRDRIEAENAADRAFYEFAVALCGPTGVRVRVS